MTLLIWYPIYNLGETFFHLGKADICTLKSNLCGDPALPMLMIWPPILVARLQDTYTSESLRRFYLLLHSAKTLGLRTLWLLLLFTTSTAFSTCNFRGALAVSSFFSVEDELSVSCFFVAEPAFSAFAAAVDFSVFCFFTAEDGFPVFCSFDAKDEFKDLCFFASAGSFPDLRFFPPGPVAAESVLLVFSFAASEGVLL